MSMRSGSLWQHAWILVAVVVAIGGIATAVIGAGSVARQNADQSRQNFQESSHEITSTLRLTIQHEQDLTASAGAYFSQNPDSTSREFRAWLQAMRAYERYPELQGIGASVIVRRSELAAFVARAQADPPGQLSPAGKFVVLPAGKRSFYCLSLLGDSRSKTAGPQQPAGYDYCSGVAGRETIRSRDSGEAYYFPLKVGSVEILSTATPVYRSGTAPTTVQARREAFLGWVGSGIVPKVALDTALRSHPNMAVEFHFRNSMSDAVFRSGSAPAGSASTSSDLRNGWTVKTSGVVASASVFSNNNALWLLISGVLLSALLGVLILVLATGRSRAYKLVEEKTSELNYLATHDALTGLPNRTLVMDRTEQMLARAERQSVGVAALFIDVDGFKQVNDSLGHAAGDAVLKTVADRLSEVVRNEDTVGRLGGDEFVVLLESTTLGASPEMVADRLVDSLHQPIELDRGVTTTVSASIGIAFSRGQSADELLRDADLALYAAKGAGRNRYVLFSQKLRSGAAAAPG